MAKSKGRGMKGGIVRKAHNSALFRHLDLIEYSVLHYAVTQTNISYRQSCILCEMHLKLIVIVLSLSLSQPASFVHGCTKQRSRAMDGASER